MSKNYKKAKNKKKNKNDVFQFLDVRNELAMLGQLAKKCDSHSNPLPSRSYTYTSDGVVRLQRRSRIGYRKNSKKKKPVQADERTRRVCT